MSESERAPTTQSRTRGASRGLAIAAAVVAILGAMTGRATLEGRAALRASDRLLAQGETLGAIAYALRAAEWYVPFAPHPRAAYDRLRTLALMAEQRGDVDGALVAWSSIRAGVRSTSSLYAPFGSRLREADDHLAALLARRPSSRAERDTPADQRATELRATFTRDEEGGAPRPLAVAAMYLGLVAWLVGASRALALGLSQRRGDDRSAGAARAWHRWAGAAVIGGIVYATALWAA